MQPVLGEVLEQRLSVEMRCPHGVGPVHVGEMGDPLLGRLRREHLIAALLLEQAISDRVDLRHDGRGLDEMRHALKPGPVGHHPTPVHRGVQE